MFIKAVLSYPIINSRTFVTLETPTKGLSKEFEQLVGTGCFHGSITPDLPTYSSLRDLVKHPSWTRHKQASSPPKLYQRKGMICVGTVATQVRSKASLMQIIKDRGSKAEALLCVSGDSMWRKMPLAKFLFNDSLWILKSARELQQKGEIPQSLELWAVANPNIEHTTKRLEAKIACGAELIVTQPPFLPDRWTQWCDMIQKKQLDKSVRFLIGIPMISSLHMFHFWCTLVKIHPQSTSRTLFPKEVDFSPEFWFQWNKQFLKAIKSSDMGGFHFMPITESDKQLTLKLLQDYPELFVPWVYLNDDSLLFPWIRQALEKHD